MGVEYIEDGFKLKIGRRRTQVTTYENMPLQTTSPIKKDKQKEIKRNIPSDYAVTRRAMLKRTSHSLKTRTGSSKSLFNV